MAHASRPAIRAVLFDFVGTLVHLREPVGVTYARMARDFGVVASPDALQTEFAKALAGMPTMAFHESEIDAIHDRERNWWRDLVELTFQAGAPASRFENFDAFFDRVFRFYARAAAWRKADEVEEILAALRQGGLRTGVLSNFDHRLVALLGAMRFEPLLDIVVLPANTGAAKPAARIFAAALERLNLAASEVLYVGDDVRQDIDAARAAGLSARHAAEMGSLLDLVESQA